MLFKRLHIGLFVLLVFIVSQAELLTAQSQTWYFGEGLGIDFSTSPPLVIDGPIATDEGCAVVTEPRGRVLFSTDGSRVYDSQGKKIAAALKGNFSSTHSAMIVPHPANPCARFLVFTVGSADTISFLDGLNVYDVRREQGKVIVEGSRKLQDAVTEKLAATPDGRGGFWLVAHDYDTSSSASAAGATGGLFYAYHIDASSTMASLRPEVSYVGSYHRGVSPWSLAYWNSIGQMKFNQQGDKLALAIYQDRIVELFAFDKATGKLTELIKLDGFGREYPQLQIYGVEFSPDGQVLYVSSGFVAHNEPAYVWAFGISILHQPTIWDGRKVVATAIANSNLKYPFGGLQLAPDGRIYIARRDRNYISAIENPNSFWSFRFVDTAFTFDRPCRLTFPTAMQTSNCLDGSNYCETLSLGLKQDEVLCQGDSSLIGPPRVKGSSYLWNTGDTSARIYGYAGRQYVLSATDTLGCELWDTVSLDLPRPLQDLRLPEDTSFCLGHGSELRFSEPHTEVLWNERVAGNSFEVESEGEVEMTISNGCESLTHHLYASFEDCHCDIWVANAFTPNNDGTNDYFRIRSVCDLQYFYLSIFDRWGRQVFQSDSPNHAWDGSFAGGTASSGVYIFKLTYKARFDEEKYRQGHLTLVR